ncbi:unnamed protein product [Rotaria sordida]|uniref:BRO1 domain-containing protein n=1 Tax=Rotaria sordida TaxID=392033 RepID=A0A815AAK4_9BILA|nr:unnamed protein product [Rotaria sordida]
MEGCPRLPAINFDLKLSIESVDLCEKIPNFITANYQENGANFSNECEQINRLRENAINCTTDESSVRCLKRYYCQLQLLRNRFPMLPDTECSVRFTWEDGFQKDENTYNDIRFEEACILYNIGAIYSRLGANETRKTHESMKNACTYFRYAAACFEKLRDQYTSYSADFTPELLTCQVDILLAQAHETVLEKSLFDQRPHSVNAHLAMQISEYCQMALLNLMKPGINSIVSKRFREWRVALTYKLSYYLSITYYCNSLIADENKKHGEAVCYLENAIERLKDGWKNAEKISTDKTNIYKDAHTFTIDMIMEKYKIVKRDNDNVYFEKVPTLSSLPAVQGAIVAKSQSFDCHDPDVSGSDIFQKLVPMDIHLAVSEYSEEKAKLLREIIQFTENKNRELETFMDCLQLDRIPFNNEYLRLPRELLDCFAAVVTRPNMSKDLITAMQQLNSQHHDITEQINEFEQLLQALEENNDAVKSNKEFKDLQINLKTIRDMMLQANENNTELHQHMTTIIEHLKILNLPLEQLEKTLPIITELDDETNKSKLSYLGLLNEKIETMKKQRETLLNDFRQKIQDDDITKFILMRRQENHKNLFSEQIKKHEEFIKIIKQNCIAQDNILHSLTETNANIANIRTKISTTLETRHQLIHEYINSFKLFDDTLSKAYEGMEFYKKQSIKLKSLNERLTTLQSQHAAKILLNHEVSSQHSILNHNIDSPIIPDRPRLKDYLAAMKPETWGSQTSRSSIKAEENMYIPPTMSTINTNTNFYTDQVLPTGPVYSNVSNMTEQKFTTLPAFNPHRQFPVQTSMPVGPSSTSLPFSLEHSIPYQQSTYNQSNPFDQNSTLFAQNFGSQPQMTYNSLNAQSFSQQQQQQQFYPSQSFQSQQSVYQPFIHHQLTQPISQNFSSHHSDLQYPSNYQCQNFGDSNRTIQQSLPALPTKYDPYRPQPIGAYDIPTTRQTTFPPPLIHPQDVYRPGGLLGINQTQIPSSSSSMTNNNNDSSQYMQYNPASNASVSSSFGNLSINSMSNH